MSAQASSEGSTPPGERQRLCEEFESDAVVAELWRLILQQAGCHLPDIASDRVRLRVQQPGSDLDNVGNVSAFKGGRFSCSLPIHRCPFLHFRPPLSCPF